MNWEMNQVQVYVVETKISQGLLASKFDMLRAMVSVPELGYDEKIFSSDDALVKSSADTLSHLDLVSVVTCAIEQSVSNLDSVVDHVGANILWHLPKSKAERRNFISVWEIKVCCLHRSCLSVNHV